VEPVKSSLGKATGEIQDTGHLRKPPRKANTDRLLQEALNGAIAEKAVTAETLLLREMKIHFCSGCFKCFDVNENDYGCQVYRDSIV